MDPESIEDMNGLYTVEIIHHRHGGQAKDLAFVQAMRLIEDRFEQSNGEIRYASIERQE